ncbi:MAG: sigma-70 family RNA polymerase sigma factor [Bacteroidota bacterium]
MLRFLRKKSTPKSDEELIDHYKTSGDMAALGQLYDRYIELVYGVCLKVLQEEASAEDAVMAIFEELTTKVKTHEIKQFRGWLHVLSRNYCLMQLRKQKRTLTKSFEPELMQIPDLGHPDHETISNGRAEALQPCMEQLPERQRHCIRLFYFEGHSYKEIAGQLDEEVGRIRSNIQNGRRNLKNCIERTNETYIRK